MNKIKLLTIVSATSLMIGCATGPEAQSGTVLGGILGAATGGIIGHQSGRGLEGAALGAGIGALGGNMYGNAQDQRNYNSYQRSMYYQPQNTYQPPCPPTVVYMQPQPRPRYYQRNYYICP
jgi:hypothetical protein